MQESTTFIGSPEEVRAQMKEADDQTVIGNFRVRTRKAVIPGPTPPGPWAPGPGDRVSFMGDREQIIEFTVSEKADVRSDVWVLQSEEGPEFWIGHEDRTVEVIPAEPLTPAIRAQATEAVVRVIAQTGDGPEGLKDLLRF